MWAGRVARSLRVTCWPWHSHILGAEIFEWENFSQSFSRESRGTKTNKVEKFISCLILETYISLYSFCENMLRKATPWPRLWIYIVCNIFVLSILKILLNTKYRKIHAYQCTYNYTLLILFSFFNLCTDLHVACMKPKFCPSYPPTPHERPSGACVRRLRKSDHPPTAS
jgi:hypothetical protein